MRVLEISATQFSLLVSVYNLSAAIAAFAGAFYLDRLDRRTSLLSLFVGFCAGTFLCGISSSFHTLLVARAIAGAFGGLITSQIFTIIGDLIPYERRGRATGAIMSAFPVASVVGVPIGLSLANAWAWETPFLALAGLSLFFFFLATRVIPSLRGHITEESFNINPIQKLKQIFTVPEHIKAYIFGVSIPLGAFAIIPFFSPFMVNNLGLAEKQLPLLYFCGGLATVFTSRIIGILCDKFGKHRMFYFVNTLAIIPIVVMTHTSRPLPLPLILTMSTVFMVLVSGRFIPAMALITSSAAPQIRGSFLSIFTSLQQASLGIAALIGSALISTNDLGQLQHFNWSGIYATVLALTSLFLARRLSATH